MQSTYFCVINYNSAHNIAILYIRQDDAVVMSRKSGKIRFSY